jgi:hypothetical protein
MGPVLQKSCVVAQPFSGMRAGFAKVLCSAIVVGTLTRLAYARVRDKPQLKHSRLTFK